MDGIHDLGGMQGFGPVAVEDNEPVFDARWQAKMVAIHQYYRSIGAWKNIDQFRHAIERIDPVAYLSHGYYGRWLGGIETLCVEAGVLTQEEISKRVEELVGVPADGSIAARPRSNPNPLGPDPGESLIQHIAAEPQFEVGQLVITRMLSHSGHTRLPRYARGSRGVIVKFNGGWVFPDTSAAGQGENPQYLYTVAFKGQELWGHEAEPHTTVHLDCFESCLKSAASEPD